MSESLPHKSCKAIHAPDWMIIDAVRYAFGRMSYQVGVTCGWLILHWPDLNVHTKTIIQNDIEGEFATADRLEDDGHFGHECDLMDWKNVRRLWLKEDEK